MDFERDNEFSGIYKELRESGAKFGDIFKELRGIDLEVHELELPVSVYNLLYRNHIHSLQQLLSASANDFKNIGPNYERKIQQIIDRLQDLTEKHTKGLNVHED